MTESNSTNLEDSAMSPEVREQLEKLHGFHLATLYRLLRLAENKVKLGTVSGDRIEDFIARELDQIDLISAIIDRESPKQVTLTTQQG